MVTTSGPGKDLKRSQLYGAHAQVGFTDVPSRRGEVPHRRGEVHNTAMNFVPDRRKHKTSQLLPATWLSR